MKHIIIDIDNEGNCSIDGKGFVGAECSKFIGEIQQELGHTKTQQTKPEYRARETRSNRQKLINGR